MPQVTSGISIVITVRNEASNLEALFQSLEVQEGPFEVILVDSESTDNTPEIVKRFVSTLNLKHIVRKCSRGEGRNIGVENASFDYIIFTDGDAIAGTDLVRNYRDLFAQGFDLVAGEVIPYGEDKFKLGRVELYYDGFEITRPSANLGYTRELFNRTGGFDTSFITAEDIDLNLRAIAASANHAFCKDCIVKNRTRSNYCAFAKQAFWNGYGRRQLKAKNAAIWQRIKKGPKLVGNRFVPNFVRLIFGAAGYFYAIL